MGRCDIGSQSPEHAGQARAALAAIVADPAHGANALGSAQAMTNLLHDLLPDSPREAGILAAAAQRNVAGTLRGHAAQGLDPEMAVRLAAAAFAASTAFTPPACEWAARELAVALGMLDPASTPARDLDEPGDSPQPNPPGPEPPPAANQPTAPARQDTPQWTGAAGSTAAVPAVGGPAPARRERRTGPALIGAAVAVALIAAAAVGYELAGSARPAAGSPPHTTLPAIAPSAGSTSTPAGSPAPTPGVAPGAGWIAQLASVEVSAGAARLDSVLARVQLSVPQARVLNSSGYASLVPGFWVVYYPGPFASGVQALAYCASRGLITKDQCIGRYLSHSPADFSDQCYPPPASPTGTCYHADPPPTSPATSAAITSRSAPQQVVEAYIAAVGQHNWPQPAGG